jgi:hypothetical protein
MGPISPSRRRNLRCEVKELVLNDRLVNLSRRQWGLAKVHVGYNRFHNCHDGEPAPDRLDGRTLKHFLKHRE